MENLSISIATVNGTGSLSANQLLAKMLFRSGWEIGSYNFFPSNIAGLPCLYNLRLNSRGWTGFSGKSDLLISLNPKNILDDLKTLCPQKGLLVFDKKEEAVVQKELELNSHLFKEIKKPWPSHQSKQELNSHLFKGKRLAMPVADSLKSLPGKTKPWLKNMIYVGFLCEWLKIEEDIIDQALKDFFPEGKSSKIAQQNKQAVQIGMDLAFQHSFPFSLPKKTLKLKKENLKAIKPQQAVEGLNVKAEKLANGHKFLTPLGPSVKAGKRTDGHQLLNRLPGPTKEGKLLEDHKTKEEDDLFSQSAYLKKEILIDGNASMALGALSAGCQFLSWYPITPASSLAESFEKFASLYQRDKKGKKKFIVVQSEDELASMAQAIGAGWAGLRAMTATSGPGLSLMSEGAGLSYFAEVPLVLCNIQRLGPSTGLPTRSQQADLLSSCFLSHGDSKHIVLLPGTPEEAFYLTAQAFDLAEVLQTLIIVLSDLDLGMNLKISSVFQGSAQALKRGKILKEGIGTAVDFLPYQDKKGDGISYRFLPGTCPGKEAYLSRGSGHNIKAEYSERPEDYQWKMDKLERKWQTAKKLMPQPIISSFEESKIALVTFGPNEQSLNELRDLLKEENQPVNFIRVRSFPFPPSVGDFLKRQSKIFVVEQNKEGQLKQILSGEFPQSAPKMKSLLQYDGRPLMAHYIKRQFDKYNPP